MFFFDSIAAEPLQLLIPLFAALVGWGTNIVAVKMMFHPIEFVGIKPFLGWQGIVPANALRLAKTGVNLITSRLLDIRVLFEGFDSKELVAAQHDHMEARTKALIQENAEKHFPQMWKMMPQNVKDQVIAMAVERIEGMTAEVLEEAADSIKELIDLEKIVSDAVVADKELMNRIFLRVGSEEFKFIERSGFYFGFLFGLVQLVVWVFYPKWWILPAFGFAVGYATNWLALKLIFDPKEPKKILLWTFQGLFHRRQKQIAKEFADIMSVRVFTPENVFVELASEGPRAKLLSMVEKRKDALMEELKAHPMAKPLFATGAVDEIEGEIMKEVETEMFREDGFIFAFGDKAEEIRHQLGTRMAVMESEAFENVLRPAFKQDEWKLILAGAVLGLGAGWLQIVLLFGEQVK